MQFTQSIVVSKDFSEAPGARYRADGPKSGEEFLQELLRPKFVAAEQEKGLLFIDLDGTWGYASSFISGSFGALAAEFGSLRVRSRLKLKSEEDSILLEKIEKELATEGGRGKALFRSGWFFAGALVALLIYLVIDFFDSITVDGTLPIVDIAQLAAALFLAMYIPFAIERFRDKQRYSRDLLISQVRDLIEGIRAVNHVVTDCVTRGTTEEQNRMQIRARFLTGNVRLGRLEAKLKAECGDTCKAALSAFRNAYDRYYEAVTGGGLYGNATIDYSFWRSQEFAFIRFDSAGTDLAKFLSHQ